MLSSVFWSARAPLLNARKPVSSTSAGSWNRFRKGELIESSATGNRQTEWRSRSWAYRAERQGVRRESSRSRVPDILRNPECRGIENYRWRRGSGWRDRRRGGTRSASARWPTDAPQRRRDRPEWETEARVRRLCAAAYRASPAGATPLPAEADPGGDPRNCSDNRRNDCNA